MMSLPGTDKAKEDFSTTSSYNASAAMMSSFGPLNEIENHFCAFHPYADDRSRHVESHHFCMHLTPEIHQCIIYSGGDEKVDKHANRRLIGIEYIITENLFQGLSDEEKKMWHSHKYEVESGLLALITKKGIPQMVDDRAEAPAMHQLHKTYGKTVHLWHPDQNGMFSELPVGLPKIMMSYTSDGQIPDDVVKARDERCGISTQQKREYRAKELPLDYVKNPGADQFEKTGKAYQLTAQDVDIKGR